MSISVVIYIHVHLYQATCINKHNIMYLPYVHIYVYMCAYVYVNIDIDKMLIHISHIYMIPYMNLLVASNRKATQIGLNHTGNLLVLKGSVSSTLPPYPIASSLYI